MADKRLYHAVAEKIRKMIDEVPYPPGSRLPGERELAESFDVSRVTIREAEIALQALGVIEIKTGSGAYVLSRESSTGNHLPIVSAFELTEARLLFEAEAAARAAQEITDETLAELDALVQKMGDSSLSEQETEDADRDFHLAIAAATGNKVIHHVVQTFWRMRTDLEDVKDVYESVCSDDVSARGDEHGEILDALKRRDPSAARSAMKSHFTRLLHSMLDATEEQALAELRRKSSESRERFLKSARL